MTMISGGDESARNAFRSILRDESSQSLLAISTQEIDAADIIAVGNLADAIARAEQAMRSESTRPRSSRDMFADLAATTDDCSGPAAYAAPCPTPVPPRPLVEPSRPQIIVVPTESDAFLQPAGRMRTLADDTLDGYRPEPTLELRLRERRKTLGWVVSGIVVAALAVVAVAAAYATSRGAVAAVTPAVVPRVAAAAPAATATTTTNATAAVAAPASDGIPVMDVRSLPAASRRATAR